jgi:amino-acid N-acetyltransferase
LELSKLPTDALETNSANFYMAEQEGEIVGTAAFEFYDWDALLRSVAIIPRLRNKGIGSQLVEFMEDEARNRQVKSIVLLTETARTFFERKGYRVVDRGSISNKTLAASSEFVYACSASAVCMVKNLRS